MSKGGHPTPVTEAMLAIQDAQRSLVRTLRAAGTTDDDIEKMLVVTPEQARLMREWAED